MSENTNGRSFGAFLTGITCVTVSVIGDVSANNEIIPYIHYANLFALYLFIMLDKTTNNTDISF